MNGKVALVTGAGSGIGKAIAMLFAERGAKVVVSDVNKDEGLAVMNAIGDRGGSASFIQCDVSDHNQVSAMINTVEKVHGRLDYACNNAGIAGEQAPTADYSVEGWQKVMDVNLNGVFYCMKYEIPLMLKSGKGAIVNIGSILSKVGFAGAPAYVAAKHGVDGVTKNAAMEYGAQGIRINNVGPAFIMTPMLGALDDATLDFLKTQHPIGRLGTSEEVANLVVWACSDEASFINGAYLPVDGAYLAR